MDGKNPLAIHLALHLLIISPQNFFMIVPRSWGALEQQRSLNQTMAVARPMATDGRFKAAAFFLFVAWVVILFSLIHSIWHYKLPRKSPLQLIGGVFRYIPINYMLLMLLSLIMVGYEAAIAFNFDISPLKVHSDLGYMYGLGWAPILAIIIVQEVWGYILPNEDKELIRQRRIRGADIDREMGITKKPHWWSRLNGNLNLNVHDQIAKNARELGGGDATRKNLERSIEMGNMPVSKRRNSENPEQNAVRFAASLLFPESTTSERSNTFRDEPERARSRSRGRSQVTRSESATSGASLNAPPQKIRSMLDV